MLMVETKYKCEMCGNESKCFSGFENVAIVEKHCILPLCEECSKKVLRFIRGKEKIKIIK